MRNSKSRTTRTQLCSHHRIVAKYGKAMPISAEACNKCNDAIIANTGYCCPMIECKKICTRYGNPDLCNFARDPNDAFKNDPEILPLHDISKELKQMAEDPKRWKKEPPKLKNGKRYGSAIPSIQGASAMNKRLAKEGKI